MYLEQKCRPLQWYKKKTYLDLVYPYNLILHHQPTLSPNIHSCTAGSGIISVTKRLCIYMAFSLCLDCSYLYFVQG